MALVLAIEPDARQGGILKRIVSELVGAELVLVESREAAIAVIDQRLPDVMLVTALLSPRDEEELVTRLRSLDGAEHLQTHTIPLLAGTRGSDSKTGKSGGLLGRFRRKKEVDQPSSGCDPEIFAEEIRTFLVRSAQLKAEGVAAIALAAEELEVDLAASKTKRRFTAEVAAAPQPDDVPAPPAIGRIIELGRSIRVEAELQVELQVVGGRLERAGAGH